MKTSVKNIRRRRRNFDINFTVDISSFFFLTNSETSRKVCYTLIKDQNKARMDHKFRLPSPCFEKLIENKVNNKLPHFSSPHGMLLPRNKQPPPMYGPRGATIPPKHMNEYAVPQINNKIEEIWCETCDRKFNSLKIFEQHKQQYRRCGIEDCNFFGCPKIVEKHIEQQHITGLYDKIKKLSTPEEIEEWRQERRRKYPTKENIERRQKTQAAKFLRGEKIEPPKNRFAKRQDQTSQKPIINQNINTNKKRTNKRSNTRKRRKFSASDKRELKENNVKETQVRKNIGKKENDTTVSEENSSISMFRGTSFLQDYEREKPVVKLTSNPIFNLVGMYGSDDSCTEEEKDESETKLESKETTNDKITMNVIENPHVVPHNQDNKELEFINLETVKKHQNLEPNEISENFFLRKIGDLTNSDSDDEAPEEMPIEKTTVTFPDEKIEEVKETKTELPIQKTDTSATHVKRKHEIQKHSIIGNKKFRKTILNYSKLRTPRQNTMLEKLLEPDIRHERNVLLQCVRFVVDNKFFNIGSKS